MFLVVLAHTWPRALGPLGPLGVLVFFVLSGYLITTLLVREHDETGRIAYQRFFLRRAARLLPALLTVVLTYAAVLLVAADPAARARGLQAVILGLTYSTDLGLAVRADVPVEMTHLWSLSVEEHFYLAWPFVVAVVLRRWGSRTLMLGAGAVALASVPFLVLVGGIQAWLPADLYFLPTTWVGALSVGATLALAQTAQPPSQAIGRVMALVGGRVSGADGLAVLAGGSIALAFRPLLQVSVATVAVVPLFARLLTVAGSETSRALSWPPLVGLGRISYGVYLLNLPLIVLAHRLFGASWMGAVACVPGAWLLWRLVESPALGAFTARASRRGLRLSGDARGSGRLAE